MAKFLFLLVMLVAAVGSMSVSASDLSSSGASPVLVELFTSEGCSSCPPADRLLQDLDRQPVSGVQFIVLSEHVDYWNHIGWKDPFSSSFFSDRQSAYSDHFGLSGVYTPQMVVDGNTEFVGSDSHRAAQAAEKARAQEKVPVHISAISWDGPHTLHAHIEAGQSGASKNADVYVVVALNQAASQVSAGENSGRHLTHVAVVQSLTKVGSLEKGKSFAQDVRLALDPKTDPANLRVIAFVQESGPGKVLGAALEHVQK
ncbi:MAG: DUF1223 domain-containing protein [Acidobacteriia bacterium]|nr:DUF1223 domain-containing protein [Terriglobia bacterium]